MLSASADNVSMSWSVVTPLRRAELASCRGCVRGLVPASDWDRYSVETRARAREEGRVVAVAPGWCHRCYPGRRQAIARLLSRTAACDLSRVDTAEPSSTASRTSEPTTLSRAAERAAARLEDLTWMAATGEALAGAAMRLGITEASVERFLLRQDDDGRAVLQQLRARKRLDVEAAA